MPPRNQARDRALYPRPKTPRLYGPLGKEENEAQSGNRIHLRSSGKGGSDYLARPRLRLLPICGRVQLPLGAMNSGSWRVRPTDSPISAVN